MKRMLINATQEEELRMAMVDGQRLYDLNIELPASERKKANIYKGTITRVEPSLEAAFVDYGSDRHGFLPLKEISSEYFVKEVESGKKTNIKDVLKEGQDIVVQIDKEERGNKGAALTTFVSLAGRFIVLKPNKARSGGVSRRIVGEDRDLARKSLHDVAIPDNMSVILRTAGIDRSAEELEWDLNNLLAVWNAILKVVLSRPSPFLIYRESNAVVRALRDYLSNDIGEILIDNEATYKEAHEFVEQVMPHNLRKLKHYSDPVPLFTRYQIETQIESAFSHDVNLPSGGSIVIDHTEALVSIDINSARATKGGDIETTAFNTNLEAAEEVGRQLRLRDLGGLIVIDFIDMGPQKNQREVENRLREAVRQDRARVQIGKISRFGLLEMSRQRLRPSLGESSNLTCPRCSGIGNIRSVESLALAILRIIGEEARKERTAKVIAQLPVEVATYLLNEKRDWVQSLESSNDTQVILVANSLLETPHYQVRRVRDDQIELPENAGSSYAIADIELEQVIPEVIQGKKPTETAAIATVVPPTPAPARKKPEAKAGPTLWERIKGLFISSEPKKASGKKRTSQRNQHRKKDSGRRGGQRSRGRGDAQRQNDSRGDNRKGGRKKQSSARRQQKQTGDAGEKKAAGKSGDKPQQKDQEQKRDDNRGEGRKTGSKRRSRGGRRRRRGGEKSESPKVSTEQQQNTADAVEKTTSEPVQKAEQKPPIDQSERTAKPANEQKQDPRPEQKQASSAGKSMDTAPVQKPVASTQPQKEPVAAQKPAPAPVEQKKESANEAKPADVPVEKTKVSTETAKPAAAESKGGVVKAENTQSQLRQLNIDGEPKAEKVETSKPARKPVEKPAENKQAAATSQVQPAKQEKEKPVSAAEPAGVAEKPAAAKPPVTTESADRKPAEPRPAAPPAQADSEQKPKGRLLPWEPDAAPAKTPGQDDKASEA